jgi:predicted SprT family Zn-dependent metalloprotease
MIRSPSCFDHVHLRNNMHRESMAFARDLFEFRCGECKEYFLKPRRVWAVRSRRCCLS